MSIKPCYYPDLYWCSVRVWGKCSIFLWLGFRFSVSQCPGLPPSHHPYTHLTFNKKVRHSWSWAVPFCHDGWTLVKLRLVICRQSYFHGRQALLRIECSGYIFKWLLSHSLCWKHILSSFWELKRAPAVKTLKSLDACPGVFNSQTWVKPSG